jgi:hypothetical protein
VILFALAAVAALVRGRAWRAAAPPPATDEVLLDDFESYASDATLRSAWGDARGDLRPQDARLDREIHRDGRVGLRLALHAGRGLRDGALGRRTGDGLPGNWSTHATFACMTRSLVSDPEGRPRTAPGEIHDLGDYLFLEVEAPDRRTGFWRRVGLTDEHNRRYLSWSGWSRWQVDLHGDTHAQDVDWSRVRAMRVAATGPAREPYFVYLDDCRLERKWRPVQNAAYFFLGVNMWDLWGRGDGPFTGTQLRRPFDEALRRDIVQKLSYLVEKRIPVLRIFLDYHFEIDPGRGLFEDEILRRIDFVINTIRVRHWPLRLMISLSTGFDVQTGISWYARQVEGDRDAKTYAFYTDPRLRSIYRRQIDHVLLHVNPATGVAWKDEPLIWSWDVSNEPRILYGTPGTSYASRTRDMLSWYAEMSGEIRRVDRKHKIISGTFYSGDGVEPHDDYDDWNIWELFTLDTIDALSVQSYVGPHLLRSGPKPVLLEEFGYGGRYFENASDKRRADNYRWLLLSDEKVYLSGVGALLWQMNWNHGTTDGKEIHTMPPSDHFVFSPDARNRSLDVFQFYLAKYNHLEVEPEIEEGWPDMRGLRWNWRSIHPPMVALRGRRFGEGYVTADAPGGYVVNRLYVPTEGKYRLWARVRGPSGRAGGFAVRIDDGPVRRLQVPPPEAGDKPWREIAVGDAVPLTVGRHDIRFEILTPGAALDRYRIVPVAEARAPH